MTSKIAEVEKSVLTVEEVMSTKISAVENSMANIREQIKSEVEQCMKIQPKQISEQTVPVIKTEKYTENKLTEKATLPAVGTAVSYTHLDVYKRQVLRVDNE